MVRPPHAPAFIVVVAVSAACTSADSGLGPVVVAVEPNPEVPTVVTVRWETDTASTGHIELARDGGAWVPYEPDLTPAVVHEQLVLGLEPDSAYAVRAVTDDGAVGDTTFLTGGVDARLPSLTTVGSGGLDGSLLVATVAGTFWGPVILDESGRVLWWHAEKRGFTTTRAWLTRDRTAVVYNAMHDSSGNLAEAADGELVRVPLDGSAPTSIPVPYLSHDFVELPDGSFACIVLAEREIDGEAVVGNALVEVSADGSSREVWNSFDHFDPRTTTRTDDTLEDWTHANALDYDEAHDRWFLSLRNFGSILAIDRATGAVEWAASGTAGTLEFADREGQFRVSHQFEYVDGRLLVFDNGDATRRSSRVLDLAVDEAGGTVTVTDIYEVGAFVYILGDVLPIGDDGRLLMLGTSGEVRRIDAAGSTTWSLSADLGYGFGYADVEPGIGVAPSP